MTNQISVIDSNRSIRPICPNSTILLSSGTKQQSTILEQHLLAPFEQPEVTAVCHILSVHLSDPIEIVVHLKPEHNSLRRMGNCLEIENPDVGDVAIVPANVNHWQRIETEVSEAIVLTIEPQFISTIAHETVPGNKVELLPTFARPDPLIQHLALNLKTALDSDNYDRLYAESLFHTLSMHLLRHYTTRQ